MWHIFRSDPFVPFRPWHGTVGDRCFYCLSSYYATQFHARHETRDSAAGNSLTFSAQLPPGFANSVGLPVVVPDLLDFGAQRGVALLTGRGFCEVSPRRYHRRSRVETKMHCVKLLGQRLMARDFNRQVAEFQVRVAVLNGFTALGIPVTGARP